LILKTLRKHWDNSKHEKYIFNFYTDDKPWPECPGRERKTG
jgi:hypothetical protein